MLLDLYYKMLWYYACCAAQLKSRIEIPNITLADGSVKNSIATSSGSWTSYAAHNVVKSMLAKPYNGIRSQSERYAGLADLWWPTNLIVGSGTTPVTASDYQVESELVDNLVSEAVSSTVDDSTGAITFRKVLRNAGGSDIEINEVGLTTPYAQAANDADAYQALIYREVLETPLVLAPGESGTVAITIKYTLPST